MAENVCGTIKWAKSCQSSEQSFMGTAMMSLLGSYYKQHSNVILCKNTQKKTFPQNIQIRKIGERR